jgi:ElaB/YqjD/DUF883 family membrane-anchored ribosome-binding protein
MVDQVDQDVGSRQASSASSNDTLRSITEQASAAGRDLKAKAGEFAGASADRLKDQAANFADTAKDVADQAGDKLKEAVTERKAAGADYVGSLAEAMRRAGREFDNELPIAGKYIRKAASQVETVADSIRTGDFSDLVRNARSFARRQPTAFLGIAALAGFAAVRFLKSSSSQTGRSSAGSGVTEAGYRDDYRN